MPSAWSDHLKHYAAENKCTYKEAMSSEKSKAAYAKVKAAAPPKEKKPRVKKEKKETPSKPNQEPLEEPLIKKKIVRRKKKQPEPTLED